MCSLGKKYASSPHVKYAFWALNSTRHQKECEGKKVLIINVFKDALSMFLCAFS